MDARKAARTRSQSPGAKRKRRALADLTNTIASSQSSSSSIIKPLKFSSSSTFNPLLKDTHNNSKSTVFAANRSDTPNAANPTSASLSPPFSGTGNDVYPERSSVYSRRRVERECTGKEIAEPFTSSIPISNPDFGDTENKARDVELRKSSAVPYKKRKQHQVRTKDNTSMHCMPQDFIEKQRAYFAEVDAFELSEEEVSADELE